MLKTRGGNRFEGYGNIKVPTGSGNRAGWQLICYECQGLSDVIHRAGASYPPKVLARLFSEQGWKVGNTSASDVCPKCLEQRRQKHKEERKQYAKGNVDRLLDLIRQVDLMLASNVTLEYGPYQPQIAAQLKSLFETAYLCNMLPADLPIGVMTPPAAPEPPPKPWPPDDDLMLIDKVASGEMSIPEARALFNPEQLPAVVPGSKLPMPLSEWQHGPHIDNMPKQQPLPEPPPPEPPPKPSPPPPPPPAQEGERISPRTAAFLAEVRKQIFKGAAV